MGWFPNKEQRNAMDEELLPSALRESQLAARRVPIWLRIAILVPPLAYTIYATITFSGLYRKVAMFEADLMNKSTYTVQLAFLLTLLVCLIPALIVMMILKRVFPKTPEELARPPRAVAREKR